MNDPTGATASGAPGPGTLPLDSCDLTDEEIAARFRWARGRGHPRFLWPDVPIDAWRGGLRRIEAAMKALLTGREDQHRLETDEEIDSKALGIAAFTSGMGPLLGCWVETEALQTDATLGALLRLHLEHGRLRAARLTAELCRTLDVLADAGLAATVVKGMHTAGLLFPEPGTRPLMDIDIVVAAGDLATAEAALASAGYERVPETLHVRPPKCDWTPPGAPRGLRSIELTHVENPYRVDLHGSLNRRLLGGVILHFDGVAVDHIRPWSEMHPAARVLSESILVPYLAAHVAQDLRRLQLVRLAELVLAIRHHDTVADTGGWDTIAALVERLGPSRFFYPAFALAERLAPGTVHPGFLADLTRAATPRMRKVMAGMEPAAAQGLGELSLAEVLMWARGPLEHLRLALHVVWPGGRGKFSRRRVWRDRIAQILGGRFSLRPPGNPRA
ncbi:MAG: nucleotidyltransferase family protein [Gemmatimonadota bacterium]|nr:MAG: nucleotidyltransferase family protein [Gemmatimonadota bacterium]